MFFFKYCNTYSLCNPCVSEFEDYFPQVSFLFRRLNLKYSHAFINVLLIFLNVKRLKCMLKFTKPSSKK